MRTWRHTPGIDDGESLLVGRCLRFAVCVKHTPYDVVQVEITPVSELAICSRMHIAAIDGKAGRLDELFLDPESGDITHLRMRARHLWGRRDVAVPASAVDYVEADTVTNM